jgi:hypothetical protein
VSVLDGPSWWEQDHFPLEVYPYAVQLMINQTAESMNVHTDMLATAILPIFGALIGNSRRMVTHQKTWTEPPRIWAAIVADPGGKKSPAISRFMSPLNGIQDGLEALHNDKIDQWKALPKTDRPPIPKPIRFRLSDITTATIRDRLTTHPRGVLVYRDELTGWLESLSGKNFGGGGDRQNWLELWPENADLQVDRRTGDESTMVREAFVGLLGGIQPEKLRHVAGRDGDDGMLDRFLLCMPPFIEEIWGTETIERQVVDAYGELVMALYELPTGEIGGRIIPKLVEMDVGGLALAKDWFIQHYAQKNNLRRTGNPLAGMWAKCDAHLYRLALILTELWHICEGGPEKADEYRLLGAGQVMDYFKNQRHRLQGILQPGEYEKGSPAHEAKVIEWLHGHERRGSMTQIRRGPLQRVSVREGDAIIDNLTQKGMVEVTRMDRTTFVVLV